MTDAERKLRAIALEMLAEAENISPKRGHSKGTVHPAPELRRWASEIVAVAVTAGGGGADHMTEDEAMDRLRDEAKGYFDGIGWRRSEFAVAVLALIDGLREADAKRLKLFQASNEEIEQLRADCQELIAATEFLTWYKDDPERPSDKMTGARVTFGELRRVVQARATHTSGERGT